MMVGVGSEERRPCTSVEKVVATTRLKVAAVVVAAVEVEAEVAVAMAEVVLMAASHH